MHPDHLGNVSVRCIQHSRQKYLNIPSRRAASKPLLTPHMRNRCLQFALRYLHGSVDDWKKVLSSALIYLSVHVQQRIQGIWVQNLTPEYFLYLAVSMPQKPQSVIKSKGYTTKWCILPCADKTLYFAKFSKCVFLYNPYLTNLFYLVSKDFS